MGGAKGADDAPKRRADAILLASGFVAFVVAGGALFWVARALVGGWGADRASPACRAEWGSPAVLFSFFADLALAAAIGGFVAWRRTGKLRGVPIGLGLAALCGGIALFMLLLLALASASPAC